MEHNPFEEDFDAEKLAEVPLQRPKGRREAPKVEEIDPPVSGTVARPHILFPDLAFDDVASIEVWKQKAVLAVNLDPTTPLAEIQKLAERHGPGVYRFRGLTVSGGSSAFNAITVTRQAGAAGITQQAIMAAIPGRAEKEVARLEKELEERDTKHRAREREFLRQLDEVEERLRLVRRKAADTEDALRDTIGDLKRQIRDLQNAPSDGLSREARERIAEARALAELEKKSPMEEAIDSAIAESIPTLVKTLVGGIGQKKTRAPAPVQNVLADD